MLVGAALLMSRTGEILFENTLKSKYGNKLWSLLLAGVLLWANSADDILMIFFFFFNFLRK